MQANTFPTIASFKENILDQFRSSPPGRRAMPYSEYLNIPDSLRSNDELDAVDHQFSTRAMEWLGFGESPISIKHNRSRAVGIPDHVIEVNGLPVLVWEDKNTTLEYDQIVHEKQLRRYTLGLCSYAVWTNAKRLIGFRVESDGKMTRIIDIDFASAFGPQPSITDFSEMESELKYLRLILGSSRFVEFDSLVDSIAIDEQTFLEGSVPLVGREALITFLDGARTVLDTLSLEAYRVFKDAQRAVADNRQNEDRIISDWESFNNDYSQRLGLASNQQILDILERIRRTIGSFSSAELREELEQLPKSGAFAGLTRGFIDRTLLTNNTLLLIRLNVHDSQHILDAFEVWKEKQSEIEQASPDLYSQQVAYVFFIRVFLTRILEDKGIICPRIASDGGFQVWRQLLARGHVESRAFIVLLNHRVGSFYQHFFHQPVFDWFFPDDYLLIFTLNFLTRWRLDTIDSDVLGFTYENYLDRTLRNKKGHFLTRTEVVDYILDLLGYNGAEILGRLLIDPACGSGSFLVRAARRYRTELINAVGVTVAGQGFLTEKSKGEIAHRFIQDIKSLFVGLELEPFSAYLAELNLLIQVLDDIQILLALGKQVSIDRFGVFVTDSLDLPDFILEGLSHVESSVSQLSLDEAYTIKTRENSYQAGFFYVVANPPYISGRRQHTASTYQQAPFFARYLTGEANTYLMFLRLGQSLLAVNGRLAMIVPLTLLGDQSAGGIRNLLCDPPIQPQTIIRFYTGNVLFPGVDQATCIIVVGTTTDKMTLGGGVSVDEAKASHTEVRSHRVISATTIDPPWYRSFLVAPNRLPYAIWSTVRYRARFSLREILRDAVTIKQGDFNATHINPCRVSGPGRGSPALRVYKGENIERYSTLPTTPSDWIRPQPQGALSGAQEAASRSAASLLDLSNDESGIALRQVARLNTRSRLIATWFQRTQGQSFGFTNKVWRMKTLPGKKQEALGVLGVINSAMIAFLYNLFSTNNSIILSEVERIPIPDLESLDLTSLVQAVERTLEQRSTYELTFAQQLNAVFESSGQARVDAQLILNQAQIPTLTISDMILRGDMSIQRLDARINSFIDSDQITLAAHLPPEPYIRLMRPYGSAILSDVMQSIRVPDPVNAGQFKALLEQRDQEATHSWQDFLNSEQDIDQFIFDWYGIRQEWRDAIICGLPWAR